MYLNCEVKSEFWEKCNFEMQSQLLDNVLIMRSNHNYKKSIQNYETKILLEICLELWDVVIIMRNKFGL